MSEVLTYSEPQPWRPDSFASTSTSAAAAYPPPGLELAERSEAARPRLGNRRESTDSSASSNTSDSSSTSLKSRLIPTQAEQKAAMRLPIIDSEGQEREFGSVLQAAGTTVRFRTFARFPANDSATGRDLCQTLVLWALCRVCPSAFNIRRQADHIL